MKKAIFVLSALGAAAAAQAQSSVTLQGTVDTALNRVTGSVASRTQVVSGANATSKLILRGVEDLGGGLYANFWLESGLFADNGTGTATNTNNQPGGTSAASAGTQGLTFNRRAIVGLGSSSWGEVHLGREWAPTYDAFTAKYDVFGVGVGIGLNYTSSINPNFIRVSNDIAYITPKFFGGLYANIQHWAGENQSGTATHDDGTGDGARVTWESGPLSILGAYARTRYAAGNAIQRDTAAAYDFGSFRLTGNFNYDQQGALKQRGWLVGASVPIGAVEWKASISQLRTMTGAHPEGTKYAFGAVYYLSKRTAVYSSVATLHNSNGSTLAIAGATTAADKSSSGLDIGLRHNF